MILQPNTSNGDVPDKHQLFGKFQAGEDRKAKLALRVAHKALDMADDDMDIQANRTTTTHSGVSTGGAIGIALAAGLPAAALAAMLLLKNPSPPVMPPTAQPPAKTTTAPVAPATDTDSILRLRLE